MHVLGGHFKSICCLKSQDVCACVCVCIRSNTVIMMMMRRNNKRKLDASRFECWLDVDSSNQTMNKLADDDGSSLLFNDKSP